MSANLNPPRDGEGDRRPLAGGGGGSSLRRPAVYAARRLRREIRLPEVLLWQRLKGSPRGLRFRKQHPVDPYVADFYCSAARLIVEIDGQAHDCGDRPERDEVRTRELEMKGYRLLRIRAIDVLADADEVAAAILGLAAATPLHQPAAGPPPRAGKDR